MMGAYTSDVGEKIRWIQGPAFPEGKIEAVIFRGASAREMIRFYSCRNRSGRGHV